MNSNIRKISYSFEELNKTKKRDCFDKVCSFIDNKRFCNGKILALYGLRRTGKTFLLNQINEKYKDITEHLEFPLTTKGGEPTHFTMQDVYDAIDECVKNGKNIILLDEITNVDDFTYDSEILADYYGKSGVCIIVAGTDSLGLKLAGNNPLLGRKPDIPMTYISFAEHSRVLNTNDIDDYIKYGGLMHEGLSEDDDMVKDITSKKRYLDSAVSGNITRSLQRYGKYNTEISGYEEIQKYTENDIKQIINKIVADWSGKFDIERINNKSIYNIVDYPLKKYRNSLSDAARIQVYNNRSKINEEYAKQVNIECDLSIPATAELMTELETALSVLCVASSLDVCRYEKTNGVWSNSKDYKEYHIVQPAIKYYQLKEAEKIYLETADLSELNYSERQFLSQELKNKIFGDMVEAIVQFDIQNCLDPDRYFVFKPEFIVNGNNAGEYDLTVYDKTMHYYFGFEVKHTDNPYSGQYKNLENEDLRKVMDYQYSTRKNVSVLYRGSSFKTPEEIYYINISDFLKTVDEYRNMDKAMEQLTKDLPVRELVKEEQKILQKKENDISNIANEGKSSISSLPISVQMENIRSGYFAKPKEKRNGIEWRGKKLKISAFEDLYIAQCEKENRKPAPEIRKHFINVCVKTCEYEPKYCNKKSLELEEGEREI